VRDRRVARRYAEALFGLARGRGAVEPVGRELAEIVRLVEGEPELRELLRRPDLGKEQKLAAVRAVLGEEFSETLTALLAALVRHGRGDSVAEVAEAYGELADEAAGIVPAEVETVVPLSQAQRQRLVGVLEGLVGRRVRLEERTDESVLAGVRVRLGDKLIDGSAAGRLARMREELMDQQGRRQ